MARSKTPKKTNGGVDSVFTTNAPPVTEPHNGAQQSTEAAPVKASEMNDTEVKSAALPKKARKPEIVKAESRSNLIPINVEDEIRQLAYLMSERRGFEPGHETEDWLRAEQEIRQRYHQHTA